LAGASKDKFDDFQDMHQFFDELDDEQRARLSKITVVRELTVDEIVARATDPVDGIYLILEGALRLESYSDDGEQFLVGMLQEGDVFGLMSVIDGKPSQHFVLPAKPTRALFVPASKFRRFVFDDLRLSRMVAEMLCQRLRMSLVLIDRFGLGSRAHRVVHCLISLAEYYSSRPRDDAQVDLAVNQYDLASMLAVSRQSVNRELKELERLGLIETRYSSIKIVDLKGLKALPKGH